MPAAPEPDRDAWENLLRRRDHPKWESLSWLALRPLISAANDKINAYAPQLVGDLRRAWVGQQQAEGRWPSVTAEDGRVYDGVVDRRSATAFVVLGDPGEQDASQYAVVPELRRVAATLRAGAFALICSDVIYPSGDVNDYVHALYLPYGPRPDGPGVAGDPLARLDILALPGNHDWYDGLAGFMFHFCSRDRLSRAVYGWGPGISFVEAMARLVWRRPSRPRPARLWTPVEPGQRSQRPEAGDRVQARPLAELRAERGLGDLQPGPYYAVELRDVLAVCIDTGIARGGRTELDPDQSAWLLRVSAHPKPKLLFTGNPLRVDLVWKQCLLSGPAAATHPEVHDVVRDPAHRYLAAAGGDIHNYQSYAAEPGTGIRYVVSGGGGAFLSATHPLALVEQRAPSLAAPEAPDVGGAPTPSTDPENSDRGTPDPAPDVRDGGGRPEPPPNPDRGGRPAVPGVRDPDLALETLYPTDVASLQRFGQVLVLRLWRLQRGLLALMAGLAAAVAATPLAVPGPGVGDGRPDTAFGVIAVGVMAVVALRFVVPLPPAAFRSRLYRAGVVALAGAVGALLGVALWWLDPDRARWNAGWWAALTAGGCLLAHLMRESSWWRTARANDPPLRAWILPVAGATWVGAAIAAAALGAPVTLGLLVVLAVTAVVGWRVRSARGQRGQRWNATAARLIYSVQGALGLAMISEIVVRPSTAWYPLAVVAGLGLAAGAAVAALAASAVVIAAVGWLLAPVFRRWTAKAGARPGAGVHPPITWREAYGILGFLGPWLTAAVVVGGPITAVAATTGTRAAHPGTGDVVLAAMAIAGGTVGSIILLDTLRRWFPSRYKPVNAVVVVASAAALWALFHGTWVLPGLLTALVVALLAVVTGLVVNLTFLRTWALFVDPVAHRSPAEAGGAEVFTEDEAREVLAWRRSSDDRLAPSSPRVRRRGRIVFPSAYQPRGPIQAKVSEFFNDDSPPFAKNFLVVRTDGREATITARRVDGLGPLEPIEEIRLPLGSR
ncbi:MAG: hypothetical protein R2761_02780 [Acidimicrobiales bacterium]